MGRDYNLMREAIQQLVLFIKHMPWGWYDAVCRYFYYKGRTNRAGFWSFSIINSLILFALFFMDELLGLVYRIYYGTIYLDFHLLFTLYALFSICPSICLCIRRLHDLNLRGWWLVLLFIPYPYSYISFFFQLLLLVVASYPSSLDNRFSYQPKNSFSS